MCTELYPPVEMTMRATCMMMRVYIKTALDHRDAYRRSSVMFISEMWMSRKARDKHGSRNLTTSCTWKYKQFLAGQLKTTKGILCEH